MSAVAFAEPVVYADANTRVAYLRRVATLTMVGLFVAAVTGTLSAFAVAAIPLLQGQLAQLAVIFGSFGVAHYAARGMVFGNSKLPGFLLASTFQGIAMGYLLLTAVLVSAATSGSPFLLISEALMLTALSAAGMVAYLWSGPRDFSMIGAGLSMLTLPMLALMVISFVFPIGGIAGIALAGVFVVVSTLALLYQLNVVIHQLRTDMHVEGAYLVTMGLLVLFWNLLTLLMSLSGRD
jgi:FtsH-binding integral membrane protein